MERKLVYDPDHDLHEVDQFGFVDLRSAYERGTIPGDMSFEELEFNQVADPTVLLPKSDDVFDRLRKAQYVREQLSQASDSDAKDLAESVVEKADSVTYN